jgi:RNA polymerase sigma-70 factor (sigma-E family)
MREESSIKFLAMGSSTLAGGLLSCMTTGLLTQQREVRVPGSVDTDDFSSFVAARWVHLVRFGYMLTGDFYGAQDLAQEALARSMTRWERIDARGAEAYVRKVMARLAWRGARRASLLRRDYVQIPVSSPEDGGERVADVAGALARLPRDQRIVLVLRYWLDLEETAVAELLNCRLGTVKSRSGRAFARLRSDPALSSYRLQEQEPPKRGTS